ncbi:acyl-CoA thioesterase [Gallaecimonas pentaromativorans]|uniref:Acyl-CoA thioesterase n=1 Tax=Gallaecimonas pentaromativorans TaxID=584787 RepID=A0A3N1PEA5_9GAMM|nr:thioesterase family protein [Gallaecimonas pentaromativorans]MED5525887.1 thioesterase family protein [Pseudomonadota bacterium]ROQ29792.1 acyl-CoA thioesterase [Gallaecimonas pentaromativorans]
MAAFSQLLSPWRALAAVQTIPTGWLRGRAVFGGLTAAMLFEHIKAKVEPDLPVRSLHFAFVAPATPGRVEVHAEELRAGRYVTQVQGELCQHGDCVLSVLASFGQARPSAVSIAPPEPRHFTEPVQCQPMPAFIEPGPEFAAHFDLCIATGALPFAGSRSRELGGWVRFKNAPEPVSIGHILALLDAWPPAVLPMLNAPAPASLLAWTIDFVEPLPAFCGDDWWHYLAEVVMAEDGYGIISARLRDKSGKLVASSRQTVAFFG